MPEAFLHFIWQSQLFNKKHLKTTTGEDLIIYKAGRHNHNSGPDFSFAHLKIGKTEWWGNIEIHCNSGDWIAHKHQHDEAYNSVILHVVYEDDKIVRNDLPTLILKGRIPIHLIKKYEQIKTAKSWIPCQALLKPNEIHQLPFWLERLAIERIEEKSNKILELKSKRVNWEQVYYEQTAYVLGLTVNAKNLMSLAKICPLEHLNKKAKTLIDIEAILFGQAGFLEIQNSQEEVICDYKQSLLSKYKKFKPNLPPQQIKYKQWKFSRLYPPNFPTIRIAQLAKLLYKRKFTFQKLIQLDNQNKIHAHFKIQASSYWNSHYQFGKQQQPKKKIIGKDRINLISINLQAPFLFLLGKEQNKMEMQEKAFLLLTQTKAENNKIIRNWKEIGFSIATAWHSQAYLQLYKSYCSQKKCLSCRIGNQILKKPELS